MRRVGGADLSRFRGPLANSYVASAALVVFALVPYLALSSALTPLLPILSESLKMSQQTLALTNGMANAAYAIGTVVAVQFAMRLRGRRMLLLYASLFLIASLIAALAPTSGLFIAGHVLQGLCTSLMLISAVPPLVTGWPGSKMPWTGATMNLCVFGAVAAGPVIGGLQAGADAWRPLFWIVAGAGIVTLVLALATFEDQPAQDRSAPLDAFALLLAGFGCAAAFFGASELQTHPMLSVLTLAPILAGVAAIALLVIYQYRTREPLMPVRLLATTKPTAGIIIAMCAAAASVAAVELTQTALKSTTSPIQAGMLFWPELGGAFVSAAVFAMLFRTRGLALLPFAGIALLGGGVAVLTGVAGGPHSLVVIGSGLIGLGVGASVAPGLFVAGLSVPSSQLPRVFALVELLRAVAAFLAAPIILHLATTTNGGLTGAGIRTGLWVCFAIAVAGGLAGTYIFRIGRAVHQRPDLERWSHGRDPAWFSPPLAAGIRARDRRGGLADVSEG